MTNAEGPTLRWEGADAAFSIGFHADGSYTWSGIADGIKSLGMRLHAGVVYRNRRAIRSTRSPSGEAFVAPPWVLSAGEVLLLDWTVGDDRLSFEFTGDGAYTWRASANGVDAAGRIFTSLDAARYDHILRPLPADVPDQLQREIDRARMEARGATDQFAAVGAAAYLEGLLYAARCTPHSSHAELAASSVGTPQ